jgi:hypothetical protein
MGLGDEGMNRIYLTESDLEKDFDIDPELKYQISRTLLLRSALGLLAGMLFVIIVVYVTFG